MKPGLTETAGENLALRHELYNAIMKTPPSVLQAVFVATSVRESEIMIMVCACNHYSYGTHSMQGI